MEIAAFWIFVAAFVIAATWRNNHRESNRHETVRFLIEKNQKLDEAQITALLNPAPSAAPEWLVHKPGYAYRGLRAVGTVVMFVALGLLVVALWRGLMLGIHDRSVLEIGTAVALVFMLGAGLFVASHFCARPAIDGNKDKRDL